MFESKILTTQDQKEWHEILDYFNIKDVNYLPEYLAIYEQENNKSSFRSFGGQGLLFVYGDSRDAIIYPFFKRSISHLSFIEGNMKEMYDIISPYGYGGPLAFSKDSINLEELWRKFFLIFHIYCQNNKIISEFCRLHPFFRNQEPVGKFSNGTIQKIGQIVYVDLSLSEDEIWSQMRRTYRRKILRAAKDSFITFETDIPDDGGQLFFDIYMENMLRIGAHEKYFFSRRFFEAALQSLDKNLGLWRICYKGDTCAAWIVLTGGDLAYAWLSGSKTEYMHLNPNNTLIYKSILKLKKEGFKYLILGGGRSTARDTLYSFKEGFSHLNRDFVIYKNVHLQKEYNRLTELQEHMELTNGEFFPKYRLEDEVEREYPESPRLEKEGPSENFNTGENVKEKLKYCGRDVIIYPLAKIVHSEMIEIGDYSMIDDFTFINGGSGIKIGRYVHIAVFTSIIGGGELVVGDYVVIGYGARIVTGTDDYHGGKRMSTALPELQRNVKHGRIILNKDVFLGSNVVVHPNVIIGEGAIIGSNSLVLKDVEPWSINVGSPCQKIGDRPRVKLEDI